ncbi:MAG: cysteine desulfurase [Verrucomicrobia bacterium]|nr:cysteine desulfurase [Verrucomicrobiota bacterium]
MRSIYFDYNATTPLDPVVRAAMLPFLDEVFGNPSSVHHVGRRARALLDDARDRVAQVWRAKPSEVVFTSGGTESNNLAIFGAARLCARAGKRHLVTSPVEHHAVLHCFRYLEKHEGFAVTYLPVDAAGRVAPDDLARALRPDTALVSVQAANNETGAVQPVAELGALCRARGVLFHTDAVQWFGKLPFADIGQFNAVLVSVCSHKFHGPKGAGALFIRSPLLPDPILFGGGHENERRAGTENLAAIIGFTEATERFVREPAFDAVKLAPLLQRLGALVDSLEGVQRRTLLSTNPKLETRNPELLPNTLAFTVAGADSIALLAGLDLEGICASSGSACSAGSLEPSHVMLAMGVEPKLANALVRLSIGRQTTLEEIAEVERALPLVIGRVRGGHRR